MGSNDFQAGLVREMTMNEKNTRNVTDPVCGLKLGPEQQVETRWHGNRQYYFCSAACGRAFAGNPEKYLKPKGFISRFLNRLARAGASETGACLT